jgi:hypothetical protein
VKESLRLPLGKGENKQCKYCHAGLLRKVLQGGRLEPVSHYDARDFCDLKHYQLWRRNGPLPIDDGMTESIKQLVGILQENPDGLDRRTLAQRMQTSDRSMRIILAAAADSMLLQNPPLVLGYCGERKVYKIAATESEALSIWWTSAGRGFKLIRRQQKMLEVIRREFQMTDQQILLEIPAAGVGL